MSRDSDFRLRSWQKNPKRRVGESCLDSYIGRKLSHGIENKKTIDIVYDGGSAPMSNRAIEPVNMFERDGFNYVEAYCQSRKEMRTFRIDRIVSAQIGGPFLNIPARPSEAGRASHKPASNADTNRIDVPGWIWAAVFLLLIYFCSR